MTIINRPFTIVLLFASYAATLLAATYYVVGQQIDRHVDDGDGLVGGVIEAVAYMTIGLFIYLAIINLTAIASLLISLRGKNRSIIKTWAVLATITASITVFILIMLY